MSGAETCVVCFPALPQRRAETLADALDSETGHMDGPTPAYAVGLDLEDEDHGLWSVSAYYAGRPEEEALHALARSLGERISEIIRLPEADWVAHGLDALPPVRAGRFTLYGSHHRARFAHRHFALEVDAGLAFGTGHHGTTRACLMALDRIMRRRRPKAVLDVGTGSGILAIAAARLDGGNGAVIAGDNDPVAVATAAANARINKVAGRIRFVAAAGAEHRRIRARAHDLILANILARPLLALAPGLRRAAAPHADLVLSGLTRRQGPRIVACYRAHGFALCGRYPLGDWMTLHMRRRTGKKRAGGSQATGSGISLGRNRLKKAKQTVRWRGRSA